MSIQLRRWTEFFERRGVRADLARVYLEYIETLAESNSPAIFEMDHLSKLLGLKADVLAAMVNSPDSFYRSFKMKKRRGGYRVISVPYPSLLEAQKWIKTYILDSFPVHAAAHGFVRGRSILTNASPHCAKNALLKIDIKDFFPSIPINWVIRIFRGFGYSRSVAFFLASLCCVRSALGQGSPTSPALSNIVMFAVDQRLSRLSRSHYVNYSRYADDLTFSGAYISRTFLDYVYRIIEDAGLQPNWQKTRLLLGTNKKKIVTGLSVVDSIPKLPRSEKRKIRQEVHFMRKFGVLSHTSKLKISDPYHLERLLGKLGFWLSIEPECSFASKAISDLRCQIS